MKTNYTTVKDVDTWAKIVTLGHYEGRHGEGGLWLYNQKIYYLKDLEPRCDIDENDHTIIFRVNTKEMEKVEKCYQQFKRSGQFSVKNFLISYFGEDALGSSYYSATYKCTSKKVAERFFNFTKDMQCYSNYLKASVDIELQGTLVIVDQYEL